MASSFLENTQAASAVRETALLRALARDELIIVDFGGARFATQSFVHALLYDAFKVPGSITKLSFVGCTKSTEESIRLVAAYAKARYRQREL